MGIKFQHEPGEITKKLQIFASSQRFGAGCVFGGSGSKPLLFLYFSCLEVINFDRGRRDLENVFDEKPINFLCLMLICRTFP